MISISVKLDVQKMQQLHGSMRKEVNKAASRALNRAIDAGKVVAGRQISAATKIKVRDVRSRLYVTGATPQRLIAELQAYPYAPNLAAFRATENKQGVAASAWERRKTYRHAFILPRTGKVVARVGEGRLPLKSLKGPSVPRTFLRQVILESIKDAALTRFKSEFEREITRRLGGKS